MAWSESRPKRELKGVGDIKRAVGKLMSANCNKLKQCKEEWAKIFL